MRELGSGVTERNYAKEPLKRAEIVAILNAVASVGDVVNTRHAIAKEKGWKVKPPSKTAFVRAALEDANVMRRPVLMVGKRAVVGRDEDAVRDLLAKQRGAGT